ncbi:hypothetical protein L6164_021714 [Bauhinia variegata]|uniref:Uncharacterized protein n=1 Tax=Bauhinia variegata TaxID=167791 RepID=A0ACB9MZC2_BAUVA|nr:hypothetical protein L6164_021714 [Bauhinia variegata]
MVRTSVKLASAKLVLVCIALLGFALVADFLWASSSPLASNWASKQSTATKIIVTKNTTTKQTHNKGNHVNNKRDTVSGRVLAAAYADLAGPELKWEKMAPAPVPRLDGAAIQIKSLLFVFAGYGTIDSVHSHVDIYNFTDNTWGGRFDMPKEMAHSHLGMVTDGRYIYVVTGQYGPQCRGPTARTFVLDTETKQWQDLPPLPAPRYAPATQLWRGRLHVMGGSKENRHAPGLEHWSLAVKDGKAIEKEWRSEIPIPRGGPHRACVVVDDRLYVIGGQEGDFMAKPGSPIFKCSRREEVVYTDVYMLDDEMKWKVLPPMPKANSHIEFAWKWSVVGKLPYRVKTTLVGFWNGWLYFTSGQRDKGPDDPSPKKVIGDMWRTKLKLSS